MTIEMMGFNEAFRSRPYGNRHLYKGNDLKSDAEYCFAQLLDVMKDAGEVVSWRYEKRDFWFEGIRRGTVSYKPDFEVTWKNGDVIYYEVKQQGGSRAISQKDITKWKRFASRY